MVNKNSEPHTRKTTVKNIKIIFIRIHQIKSMSMNLFFQFLFLFGQVFLFIGFLLQIVLKDFAYHFCLLSGMDGTLFMNCFLVLCVIAFCVKQSDVRRHIFLRVFLFFLTSFVHMWCLVLECSLKLLALML